jgi:hypothetical protein
MEEFTAETLGIYEDLPKASRRVLHKEFRAGTGRRAKIFLWTGIAFIIPMLVCCGFALYYMFRVWTQGITYEMYFFVMATTLFGIAGMALASQYHKRFRFWLKADKNIIFRQNLV